MECNTDRRPNGLDRPPLLRELREGFAAVHRWPTKGKYLRFQATVLLWYSLFLGLELEKTEYLHGSRWVYVRPQQSQSIRHNQPTFALHNIPNQMTFEFQLNCNYNFLIQTSPSRLASVDATSIRGTIGLCCTLKGMLLNV